MLFDLRPPMNGWDSLALAIPWGMPTDGNFPTEMVVLRFAGSVSALFRGLVRLPVTGLSARGTLAPSVRRHDGSTVVFSRVAAGRAIGLTAISSLVSRWQVRAGSLFVDGDTHPTPRFPTCLPHYIMPDD